MKTTPDARSQLPVPKGELDPNARHDHIYILPSLIANQGARGEDGDKRQRGRREAETLAHKERPDARAVQPKRVLLRRAVARGTGVGDTKSFASP